MKRSLKFLFAGMVCTLFVGCAASNGGGHVVGNPLVSEKQSAYAGKSSEGCGCKHHQRGDKGHAGCGGHEHCGCAKGAVSGEGSCGGEHGCGCGHKE